MAEKIEPIAKLTAEQKKALEDLDAKVASLKTSAESLKELGFGVDDIMERIEWAERTRKMLLEKFT